MMTQAQLQRRIPYLDILRVLACFLVILIHTPIRPMTSTITRHR